MKDKDAMLAAMKKEIAFHPPNLKLQTSNPKLETLYFGGGTPSVLSINELSGLIDTVRQYYTISADTEITLEANPDDLTDDYLEGLFDLEFNRLSIGVQSFFDDDLQWMNRRHNAAEAVQSVEKAHRHGFHNINIDLIYGLPKMTLERWEANLTQALALNVSHLSAYHLLIEARSVFGKRQSKGEVFNVSEDESVDQFDTLINMTEKTGYEHYEISNFARPGFRSRHNTAHWQLKPYMGIGPSAHSYDGHSRQWNISNNSRYIAALESSTIWFEREILTPADKYNEYILVSLRAAWGADINHIRARFGDDLANDFLQHAAAYVQNGYMYEQSGVYILTQKGKFTADGIVADFFKV